MKKIIKKSALIFLSSMTISAILCANISLALAAAGSTDEEKIQKVYYTEPLGVDGEEKVYQVTACTKEPSYAPLRCYKENADNPKFKDQCYSNGKLREGAIIMGCVTQKADPDHPYPQVDTEKFTKNQKAGGCSDASDLQSPYYVPEVAVISKVDSDGKELPEARWQILGTIAWPDNDNTKLPQSLIDQISKEPKKDVVNYYRTGLCSTRDHIAKDGSEEQVGVLTETVKTLNADVRASALALIGLGCNNNNTSLSSSDAERLQQAKNDSQQKLGEGENGPQQDSRVISTKFNNTPSVTCSTKYRISGTGGIDIFSKYVKLLYTWAGGVVGIVCVFNIVYNGIIISASGSGETTEAKEHIMQSLAGLALLFLAGLLLYTINPGFFTA